MPLLFDNDWLRNRIEADPDDSELSAGTTTSPDPTPSDDLVRRLNIPLIFDPSPETMRPNLAIANKDRSEAADRIMELEKEVHDQAWNLGGCDAVASGWVKRYETPAKELSRPALYSVIRMADKLRDAEAEVARLTQERDEALLQEKQQHDNAASLATENAKLRRVVEAAKDVRTLTTHTTERGRLALKQFDAALKELDAP